MKHPFLLLLTLLPLVKLMAQEPRPIEPALAKKITIAESAFAKRLSPTCKSWTTTYGQ